MGRGCRLYLLQQVGREEAQFTASADLEVAVHLLALLHHDLHETEKKRLLPLLFCRCGVGVHVDYIN